MADVKFTPGPWRVGETGFMGTGVLPSTGEMRTEGGPIIACWDACFGKDEAFANACLVAASPDLYDALVKARNTLAGVGMRNIATDICDAALAKAEGRS